MRSVFLCIAAVVVYTSSLFAEEQRAWLDILSPEALRTCQRFFKKEVPTTDDFNLLTIPRLAVTTRLSIEDKGLMLLAAQQYLSQFDGWDYGSATNLEPSAHTTVKNMQGQFIDATNFNLNAYLNMQTDRRVKDGAIAAIEQFGTGSGAARLIGGTTSAIVDLEKKLAKFTLQDDAIVTASGFQANLVVWTILQQGDFVLEDGASHKSNSDGIVLGKNRYKDEIVHRQFAHNDMQDLEKLLREARQQIATEGDNKTGRQIYISVEGIYSMDGDRAPLVDIVSLAKQYNAKIVIDDAHGFGVTGENGRGTAHSLGVAKDMYLQVGTLSKSFGSQGGFISGNARAMQALRFLGSNYVFTAALAPPSIGAAATALDLILDDQKPSPVDRLQANVDEAHAKLAAAGLPIPPRSEIHGGIIPVSISALRNRRAIPFYLKQFGIIAVIVEFPAVPKTKPIIRLGFMTDHTSADFDKLVSALQAVFADPMFAPAPTGP